MNTGKLIVIDGMDGAGKTTAIDYIAKQLFKKHGIQVHKQSVWMTNPFSHTCRSIIVQPEQKLTTETALAVAIAGVLYSYNEFVRPMVEKGKIVLLDRGPRSSLALQVAPYVSSSVWFSNQHAPSLVSMWNGAFSNFSMDREISIVIDSERMKDRIHARGDVPDGIESKAADFHDQTREAYVVNKKKADVIVNNGSLSKFKKKLDVIVHDIAQMCEQ